MATPYTDKNTDKWLSITEQLVAKHPLSVDEIRETVLKAWGDIFNSKMGSFFIGKDIFPPPQIMAFLLHELVDHYLGLNHPGLYKVGTIKGEKDIHCIKDQNFSIEIKASSDKSKVFANRSYAQPQDGTGNHAKNGYYITINFEKFDVPNRQPEITVIRFGYLEHSDWKAQAAATGQQASLTKDAYSYKLIQIYPILKKEAVIETSTPTLFS